MNHRGREIGYYRFDIQDEGVGTMTCHNPYPCAFDLGIIEATTKKFAPRRKQITINHKDGECRDKGGDTCIYQIKW